MPRCDARCRQRSKSTIQERTPIAHRPDGGRLYLVDERGAVIDEYGPHTPNLDLPIIDGLAGAPRRPPARIVDEAATAAMQAGTRAARAALAQRYARQ